MQEANINKFDKEEEFEKAFIELLKNCGWEKEVISYPTEDDLLKNWGEILFNNNREKDRLGDYPLTDGEMKQILEQIITLRTPFALNGFINGKEISIKRDNPNDKLHLGKEINLHIYDRLEIAGGKSRYQIVRQPKFKALSSIFPNRRGDVMLLINGMPIFHIELKKSDVPISTAWNQISKYSKEHIFSGIFSLIQIFIAMTPEDSVYFTNPGYDGKFNSDFYFHWANVDNVPITEWREFTQNLLYIPMAHQLIGFYTVADGKDGILKVLRSYQYYAVSAITNKVKMNHWEEKNQRGGYIWHTTGSGKTLTSFKSADLIAKSQDADKVIFLVDRKELDTQSLENYKLFADNKDDVNDTKSTDILISKLKSDKENLLIVTSIQKMSRIVEDGSTKRQRDIEIINKKRIVFIVDECHRDTFGDMMKNIKNTFNYALFFGFSGTPIQEENKKKGCTSSDVFGDELHRYTIGDGIRDKNVLAFDPYMIKTFDDMEIKKHIALEKVHVKNESEAINNPQKSTKYYNLINNLPMAGYVDKNGNYINGAEDFLPISQYTTDKHINAVILDITKRYERVSHAKKFHSIFATSGIPEAIEYYRRLKKEFPSLKTTVLIDPSDNNDNANFEKIQGLAEIISDYNKRYKQKYSITKYGEMKKDISLRLAHEKSYKGIEKTPEQQVDMLIVVNQMLTGFDSKWINTLYLDKLMRQENIIQAFSRTNRIYGIDKPVGIIYYYRYPNTMKKNIEEAVKMYSGDKEYMVFVDKLEKNLEKLNAIYIEIEELFKNEEIVGFTHLPQDTTVRAKFAHLFNQLNAIIEMIKVQDFTWDNLIYQKIKVLLTKEIFLILLQRYRELFKSGLGFTDEEPPYDLDFHITEISTGKIDADYMNSRFEKFMKLKLDITSKKNIEDALQTLYKSFAMLPEEEQKFAEIFIKDVQLGNIIPEKDKTFRDYVTEYICIAKDNQINRFAEVFGLDKNKLSKLINLHLTADTIDEFDRINDLKNTADNEKVKAYFEKLTGKETSIFKINSKFDNLLRQFVIQGGFEL